MRKSTIFGVACWVLAGSLALWAQGQGGGNQGSSGNTGNNTGGGGRNQGGQQGGQGQQTGTLGTGNQQNNPFGTNQDPFASQMRPLYLNGRVVTSDGLAPAEPVVIQRVCTGNTYPEGYSDSKGRFSFQVGGDLSMLTTDASVSGSRVSGPGAMMSGGSYTNDGIRQVGLGRYDLSQCVLRAELSGYRSDDVHLGMYSTMGKNDVGVIVLHRLDGLVGNVVSALTLQAPKSAQKAYQSGLREMMKKKPNYKKAAAQFDKAVKQFPRFAAAWSAMGDAKIGLEDESGAKLAYAESVKHDPKYLKPYEPLIRIAVDQSDWQGMESLGSAYLELNPNSENVRFLTAVAALNTGKYDKAEEMVLAMRVGSSANVHPQSYQIMGMIHEQRAEFEKAAEQYRAFVEVTAEPESRNVGAVQRKLHEWEMLGVIEKSQSP